MTPTGKRFKIFKRGWAWIAVLVLSLSAPALVFAAWTPVRITSLGRPASTVSMAIVNGNPAVAFYDEVIAGVAYARALNPEGTLWNPPTVLPNTAGAQYPWLVMVNGNPAITYFDFSEAGIGRGMKFVRALDADGTTWDTPVVADNTGLVAGYYANSATINGNPAIAYLNGSSGYLAYVRALDANGATWGTPVVVDNSSVDSRHYSMADVNGRPAISYFDNDNRDLRYVRASDASGTAWGAPQVLDSVGDVGYDTSLAVVNGNPAITYYDNTMTSTLKYIRALDPAGTTWGSPVNVADSIGRGIGSLQVVNGKPATLRYFVGTVEYVAANDADGTTWAAPVVVDSGVPSLGSMVVLSNGNPGLAYSYNPTTEFGEGVRFATDTGPTAIEVTGVTGTPVTPNWGWLVAGLGVGLVGLMLWRRRR